MNTADLIGYSYPKTLPEAHKEIERLREIAREWMAFGGEALAAGDAAKLDALVYAVGRLKLSGVHPRNAVRVLFAMSSRLGRVWSREALRSQIDVFRCWSRDDYEIDGFGGNTKVCDVLLVSARKLLRHLGHASSLQTSFGHGWILHSDGWAAVQALADGGDA